MDKAPLKSYCYKILFAKRPVKDFPFVLFICLQILFMVFWIIYSWNVLAAIAFIFMILGIVYMLVELFLLNYSFYKEFEYRKTCVSESIEKIKSDVTPEIWACLKQLDKRVEDIEKNLSPNRLALLAFFVAVALAIAIPLIFTFFPK